MRRIGGISDGDNCQRKKLSREGGGIKKERRQTEGGMERQREGVMERQREASRYLGEEHPTRRVASSKVLDGYMPSEFMARKKVSMTRENEAGRAVEDQCGDSKGSLMQGWWS